MLPLLVFIAPIGLIVLSAMRISDGLKMSIGNLTGYMMLLGCIMAYVSLRLVSGDAPPGPRCAMPEMAVLMGGLFIAIVVVPIIGGICGLIYRATHNRSNNA